MSHEIYTTKGFIISSENKAEADKTFFVFTKDIGLVRANASGVRKNESKLRYALQEFDFSEISFVLGKHGWKIVNATPLNFFSEKIRKSQTKVQVLRLLKKLCPQDEPHPNLFDELTRAFLFMEENKILSDKSMDALLALKILSYFGYWGDGEEYSFTQSPFNQEVLNQITKVRQDIVKEVNKSLRATQLI
ncbi:MAG: DNA repair protein RecO [Candidatus Paceibacterota bacterium]